ncbi:MAG: hypothetical protein O3C10_14205, partial [Chloroflexi bacterium]|nr:hypothetical protein [Chloroflexota bacterium]
VVDLNLQRRHLDASGRAAAAANSEAALDAERAGARERQAATQAKPGEQAHRRVRQKIATPEKESGRALDKVAARFRTNRTYIRQAIKLRDEAPDDFAKLAKGEKSLSDVTREENIRKRQTKREQIAVTLTEPVSLTEIGAQRRYGQPGLLQAALARTDPLATAGVYQRATVLQHVKKPTPYRSPTTTAANTSSTRNLRGVVLLLLFLLLTNGYPYPLQRPLPPTTANADALLPPPAAGTPNRAAMHELRQRPSHVICGLCPSIADTSIGLRFPHMLVLHAVLYHAVGDALSLSRRVCAPSGTVSWRLPDGRERALLRMASDFRI